MNYQLMHQYTAVLELDIDKLGMIVKVGAVSAQEHLPIGVRVTECHCQCSYDTMKEIAQQQAHTDDLGEDLTENIAQTY